MGFIFLSIHSVLDMQIRFECIQCFQTILSIKTFYSLRLLEFDTMDTFMKPMRLSLCTFCFDNLSRVFLATYRSCETLQGIIFISFFKAVIMLAEFSIIISYAVHKLCHDR